MLSSIKKLNELSIYPRLSKDQIPIARKCMRRLRELGFTIKEVSILTKGRWKVDSVKKYTSGAKVQSTVEKNEALNLLIDLATSDTSIADVEDYQKTKKQLDDHGVSVISLLELYLDLQRKDVNVVDFIRVNQEVKNSERSLESIIKDLDREEELLQKGLSIVNMETIHKTAELYGDFEEMMNALETFKEIKALIDEKVRIGLEVHGLQQTMDSLQTEKERLELENATLGQYAETARALLRNNFSILEVIAFRKNVETFGGFIEVSNAVLEYNNINEIVEKKETLIITNKEIEEETRSKKAELQVARNFLDEANRMIGEIEANMKKSIQAQIVYSLMSDPESVEIDPSRLKRYVLYFLLGFRQYYRKNKEALSELSIFETPLNIIIKDLSDIS